MRNGKHAKRGGYRIFTVLLALVLVFCAAVTGTLAWLTDKTDTVTNTFTVGNIDITLTETGIDANNAKSFKMVPGTDITKDPKVTVKAKSEACWLFVKVEESENFDSFLTYTIADDWTELTAGTGVYYCQVAATTADKSFSVLADDKVHVKDTVTKAMMDAITAGTATAPTLKFTAYAVQQEGSSTAAAAWDKAEK